LFLQVRSVVGHFDPIWSELETTPSIVNERSIDEFQFR